MLSRKLIVMAMLAALPALQPGLAAAADSDDLLAEVRRLADRIKALEERNQSLEKALGNEYRRESDPEVASRIKTLESQTTEMREKKGILDALDGIKVGGSLTSVAQSAPTRATAAERSANELNWRGDLTAEVPLGESGDNGKLFAHVRVGQGNGVMPKLRPTYTGNVNATAFALGGSSDASDSTALLAQLWYQMEFGLPDADQKTDRHFELTFGKMDPFVFFDQNAAADDESSRFLNNVFVHGAQLDSGGDAGVDSYGFSPGVRLAYRDESEGTQSWQVSGAMFGSGNGVTYSSSFTRPFTIVQAERGIKLFHGLDGNYRVYAWRNGRASNFDGLEAAHSGWGLSFDQRVPGGVLLFTRYGQQTSGRVMFDRSLSAGAELSGNAWNRGADAIGVAAGSLRTSKAWKEESNVIVAYDASGNESNYELYYRWQINPSLQLTPDLQYVRKPAANPDAKGIMTYGLRAKASF
jgi:hypothetical protein